MKDVLFIKGNRSAYGIENIEDRTITVGELIEILQDYDDDMKIFISNDNGYTYGYINEDTISTNADEE